MVDQEGRSFSTPNLHERSDTAPYGDSRSDLIGMVPLTRETTPSTLVSRDSFQGPSEDTRYGTPSISEEEQSEETKTTKPPKEPKISWFLTIFLLLTVILVSERVL